MDYHFINTDKKRQSQDEWFRRGIAVVTDTEVLGSRLGRVPAGDRLLMYVNGAGVVAVGQVRDAPLSEVRDSTRMVYPKENVEFHKQVDWTLDLRDNPLHYLDLPFQPVGTLQRLDKHRETVLQLVRDAARLTAASQSAREVAGQVEADVTAMRADNSVDAPTREALVQARLGQGKFRQDLIEAFDGCCAVSDVRFLPVLRASHIVPWKLSTNQERLDPDNGLLLTANLDALFDRALITFDAADGALRVSSLIPQEQRELLLELRPLQAVPSPRRAAYLKRHNEVFGQAEEAALRISRLLPT